LANVPRSCFGSLRDSLRFLNNLWKERPHDEQFKNSKNKTRVPPAPLNVMLTALALLLLPLALVAPAWADPGDDNRAPDLGDCQILQVPAGNEVSFHVFGAGVQIYR
jgi:hypothetical protein